MGSRLSAELAKLKDATSAPSAVAALIVLGIAFFSSPGRKLYAIETENNKNKSSSLPPTVKSATQTDSFRKSNKKGKVLPPPLHHISEQSTHDDGGVSREERNLMKGKASLIKILFLLRCAVPHFGGKQLGLVVSLFTLFLGKIAFTIRTGSMVGALAGHAMQGDLSGLFREMTHHFFRTCVPLSLIIAAFSYVRDIIELDLRAGLSSYFVHRYLRSKVFFRIAALHGVENLDQHLTVGVKTWCSLLMRVLISVVMSTVEVVVYTRVLQKRTGGWAGPAVAWVFSGVLPAFYSYCFAPPIEYLARERLANRSAFEKCHRNIVSFAEEIALTNASAAVQQSSGMLFQKLTDHARIGSYLHSRFQLGNIGLTRYLSSLLTVLIGWMGVRSHEASSNMMTRADSSSLQQKEKDKDTRSPSRWSSLFTPLPVNASMISSRNERIKIYSRATYNCTSLKLAFNEIILHARVFMSLKVYTGDLYSIVEELNSAEEMTESHFTNKAAESPKSMKDLFSPTSLPGSILSPTFSSFSSSLPNSYVNEGIVSKSSHIQFIDVPIILPNGQCLCKHLSFHVRPGMNLLVTGPNGCGKSSILRLLGELWPLQHGVILKPSSRHIYFVPQKPYMFEGSIVDHIIYPDRKEDFSEDIETLYALLRVVGLDHFVPTGNDENASDPLRFSITDSLSTGEQQRLSFARLFYHKPQYAILDESSSAMDIDMESMVYSNCQRLGISLITVAHRQSVWKHHNWILYFDGKGGYLFSPMVVYENEKIIELSRIEKALGTSTMPQETVRYTFEEFSNAIL